MNIYIFVITIVACFTLKTFAAEQKQGTTSELKSKQLELIIKTLEEKPKKEAKEISSI